MKKLFVALATTSFMISVAANAAVVKDTSVPTTSTATEKADTNDVSKKEVKKHHKHRKLHKNPEDFGRPERPEDRPELKGKKAEKGQIPEEEPSESDEE